VEGRRAKVNKRVTCSQVGKRAYRAAYVDKGGGGELGAMKEVEEGEVERKRAGFVINAGKDSKRERCICSMQLIALKEKIREDRED